MPEWGSSGSVRGDTSNGVPYRDRSLRALVDEMKDRFGSTPIIENCEPNFRKGRRLPRK